MSHENSIKFVNGEFQVYENGVKVLSFGVEEIINYLISVHTGSIFSVHVKQFIEKYIGKIEISDSSIDVEIQDDESSQFMANIEIATSLNNEFTNYLLSHGSENECESSEIINLFIFNYRAQLLSIFSKIIGDTTIDKQVYSSIITYSSILSLQTIKQSINFVKQLQHDVKKLENHIDKIRPMEEKNVVSNYFNDE
jgi:hypothetical protein